MCWLSLWINYRSISNADKNHSDIIKLIHGDGIWLVRSRSVQLFRNIAIMYSEVLLYSYSITGTSPMRQKEKLQASEYQILDTIGTNLPLVRNSNLLFFFDMSDFI